jgi:hypothetical protein
MTVRMQLVAREPESGHLLFANCAGLKAGTRPELEFSTQLTTGEVQLLDSGASFSRCLAQAVGIDSVAAAQGFLQGGGNASAPPAVDPEPPPGPAPETAAIDESSLIPDLPNGTWMGFHDGETPLLAKLTMHDRQRGIYIFTNREGVKLRQLHQSEFLDLIEQGMVDIMESRVDFRDLVKRKQRQLKQ